MGGLIAVVFDDISSSRFEYEYMNMRVPAALQEPTEGWTDSELTG
jgi:hypothetical protein